MSADLDPRDDLTDRLRALGQRPVDPALRSEHLTAMAGAGRGSAFRTSLAGRLKIGAGVLAGFLLGATGLTTAGALGPVQSIAATAVEHATPLKGLPESASTKAKEKADKEAKANRLADGSIGTERNWVGCYGTGGEKNVGPFAGNHGQYLKQERAAGRLAEAMDAGKDCGKPIGGDDEDEATDQAEKNEAPEVEGAEKGKSDDEHGKADAPGQDKAKDAKDKAAKGDDADDDEDADEDEADEAKPAETGNADAAGQPSTTPAVPDVANDKAATATDNAPEHTPGSPAEPTNGNGGSEKLDTEV